MDNTQKEQIICAIYSAIYHQNYRCAQTILDDLIQQITNITLDRVIETIQYDDFNELTDKIRKLKEN